MQLSVSHLAQNAIEPLGRITLTANLDVLRIDAIVNSALCKCTRTLSLPFRRPSYVDRLFFTITTLKTGYPDVNASDFVVYNAI